MNLFRYSLLSLCCLGLLIFSGCNKDETITENSDTVKKWNPIDHVFNNPRARDQINKFCGYNCKDNYDEYLSYTIHNSQQLSGQETTVTITAQPTYQTSFPDSLFYTFKEQEVNGEKIVSLRDKNHECLENCPLLPGIPQEATEHITRKYGDNKDISGRVGFSENFQKGNYYIAYARLTPEDFIMGESINTEPEQLFIGTYWSGGWLDLYQGSSGEVSCEVLEKFHYPSALLEQYNMKCTPGADYSIPIETKNILGMSGTISEIVGETITPTQDKKTFLSHYLREQGIYNYIIEKEEKKGNITTISMKPNSEFGCHFEAGGCMVFIFRNNQVIWENATSYLGCSLNNDCVGGHGRFYRYTDNGVLLEIQNGEGLGCIDGITYTYQYIHLKDLKSIWSVLDIMKKGVSPDPQDKRCQNKNTKRTTSETLRFFSSYEDTRQSEKVLNIQAKTTEQAYYKYYNQ